VKRPVASRLRSGRDRTGDYGLVLVSIVVTIIVAAAVGRSQWGRWFAGLLQGATLLLTMRISGARPLTRRVVFVLVALFLVGAAISVAVGDLETTQLMTGLVGGLLAVGAPVAIFRGVLGNFEVTARTVLAALSIYLLIGLFFTFAYSVMAAVDSKPFFASGIDGVLPDHLYFSYVTMTTVGFGDLTARSDIGRMAAALQALVGQLYLVTVVALLVGNLRGRRE
jgi:Ion channel